MTTPAKKQTTAPVKGGSNDHSANVVFAPFMAMQKQINELFEDNMKRFSHLPAWTGMEKSFPKLDVKEDDEAFHIKTRIPTKNTDDVDVSVSGNSMTIKCHCEEHDEEKNKDFQRSTFSASDYQRTFIIPDTADGERAEAEVKGEHLKITLPKRPEAIEKSRKITVKKAK